MAEVEARAGAATGWRGFARSTIGRFVGLAFLCQFLVTGGVLLFVQQASQRTVVAADRDAVHDLRDELLRVARERGAAGLRQDIERRLPTVRSERIVLLLTDAQGRIVAGNLGAWPTTIPDNTPWRTIELYRIGGEQPEPIGVSTSRLPDGGRLLAGIVTSHSLQLTRIYEEALTIAFLMKNTVTAALQQFHSRQAHAQQSTTHSSPSEAVCLSIS